jgi:O-succinylbenzoate synthase
MSKLDFIMRRAIVLLALVVCQTAVDRREPASRAAVVLTWDQAQRENGFAGMEKLFLTHTVRDPRLILSRPAIRSPRLKAVAAVPPISLDSSPSRKSLDCSYCRTARSVSNGTH